MAGVDVSLVSLGGMLSDDPGLSRIGRLWHLYGSKDRLQGLGAVLFPGRWRINALSNWNRARAEGRITMTKLDGMVHDGKGDYFDRREHEGTSNAQRTADQIGAALRG